MDRIASVPRVGRNDPCPCGSGKKYKHCHMLKEQQVTTSAVQLRQARETAYAKLAEYIQGERFLPDLAASMELFWDRRLQAEQINRVVPLHRYRALDFFLFDYRTAEGDRIVDRFAAEQRARLAPEERTVLKQWSDGYVGVYAVQRTEAEAFHVRDLLLGGDKRVEGALPPPLANPNMVLVGRLAPATPPYFVNDLFLPMPVKRAAELVEWLTPRFEAYQAQRYGARWPDFLKAESYLVNHFLLTDAEFLPAPKSPVATPDRNRELEIAEEAVRRVHSGLIIGTLDQHYSQWLDRPIEGWGNRSPRQLMADEAGQARVQLLLSVLERAEDVRRAAGQPAYEVNRLRAQLGLLGAGVL